MPIPNARVRRLGRRIALLAGAALLPAAAATAQEPGKAAPSAPIRVLAIAPPRNPLPPEAASAGVTRFSYIVYGDTRGREDGTNPQYEHSLIVASMLRTIAQLSTGPDPVRFVLQSGDAVVNGQEARQWNVSFSGLVNRITTEGGVPYFLAPGNHDVTSSDDTAAAGRKVGLRNYFDALQTLIPPEGSGRRLKGYPTFAFGYGNTFVLAFDSDIAADPTQLAWAETQLAGLDRSRYTHLVALFHHPAFSSGPHGAANVEPQTAQVRARWMPLFRKYGVELLFTGHEHFFEHWVERYRDAAGQRRRMDQIVTGGGGAPLYAYQGEPDLRGYIAAADADSVRLEHLVRPGETPGLNPYHYVVVRVNGSRVTLDVVAVDWGRGFRPYRSAHTSLSDDDR